MYQWTLIMRNGNKYTIKTNQSSVDKLLNESFPIISDPSTSFSAFELIEQVDGQNNILIKYSEISEILWKS